MAEKKKSIFQNIANAFTNKDEIAAAEKAAADKAAAEKAAATAAKAASDRALAAEKASRAKAVASQAAANKLAADKAAASRAAALRTEQARAAAAAASAAAAAAAAAKPKPGTVNVKSLRVRKDHSVESPVVAGLSFGEKVSILDIWTDGKNTWAHLGPDKWAAIKYDGEEMIKLD